MAVSNGRWRVAVCAGGVAPAEDQHGSPKTWFKLAVLSGALLLCWPLLAADVESDSDVDLTVKVRSEPFTNSVGMKFVRVKAGTFTMGSPKGEKDRHDDERQHEVEITKDFFLGVTEVTQKQYKTVMGDNPSYFSKGGKGKDEVKGKDTDDFPVENVSWQDAREFLKKLNKLAAEKKYQVQYRLPSEAQWEYACRGGPSFKDNKAKAQLPFHFKSPTASLSSSQANFDGEYPYGGAAKGKHLGRTCKVGSYQENALGLLDVHGNVWEWCSDWYGQDYYAKSPRKDPPGPASGSDRVLRGGGWDYGGQNCRAAYRLWYSPSHRVSYLGFRVAAVPHE